MRIAKGPRPWAIHAFTASIFAIALLNLTTSLSDLNQTRGVLAALFPQVDWDRDTVIVALFTEFTISLIPLVWIFVFAAGYARWIILTFGILKLLWILFALLGALLIAGGALLVLVELALVVAALVFLFLPGATDWLDKQRELPDPETFA